MLFFFFLFVPLVNNSTTYDGVVLTKEIAEILKSCNTQNHLLSEVRQVINNRKKKISLIILNSEGKLSI